MPICNNYGDVIGVAQIVNKKGGKDLFFTEKELKVEIFFLLSQKLTF